MTEQVQETGADFNPDRAPQPRAEEFRRARRRRRAGTINRGVQMKLDIFDAEQLDLVNWVYRWANDEDNRMAMLTRADDYDFVNPKDIAGYDAATSAIDTDSESLGRVRMIVGTNKGGNPIYSYLLRKPRDYWEEDMADNVRSREATMAGRVYEGHSGGFEGGGDAPPDGSDTDTFYVPKTAQVAIPSAARRKSGPILKTKG